MRLHGIWVPLVTPMRDGRLDTVSLRRLCEHLLGQGVDGLVACGSTGEAALLTAEEHAEVVATVAGVADDRVLAGAVAVSIADATRLVAGAAAAGASGALVLGPGLVGPTQPELAAHYRAVADASPIPVLIYNFPARTGAGVAADTTLALAEHPNITGTKQSVPVLDAELQRTILQAPDGFTVMVGFAALLWPALALGADGGILAAAHLEAPAFVQLARFAAEGDLKAGANLQREVFGRLAAIEGIAPLKRELHRAGVIASPELRPPLAQA